MNKIKDRTGQKYNKLTFIKPLDKRISTGAVIWEVQCECGAIVERVAEAIVKGKLKSCGCAAYTYSLNKDIFFNENDISYYILGLYITDGNIFFKSKKDGSRGSGSIDLSSIDIDILEKIRDMVCPNLPIKKVVNTNCSRLRISNTEIANWFVLNECIPNKTKIVKFPNIPPKYLKDFVRGLIDGDGSIGLYDRGPMVRFDSASFLLIETLCEVIKQWNISCKIIKTKWFKGELNGKPIESKTQMYRITLSGINAYKLLKIIYKDHRIGILRKEKLAQTIFLFIEEKGFSEEEAMKLDKIPNPNIVKWPNDDELVAICLKHKGVFKNIGEELGIAGWTVSQRLQKIGKYDYIRSIYPFVNVNNIRNYKD